MTDALDRLAIDTLRFLSVDMVQKADSGHPGLPLGAAPMAYVLWSRWLKCNPRDPDWDDRDRFVLSAGHGSALLYSLLHLAGYDVSMQDIQSFRQWGSKCPGHPERGHTSGVEVTTGPLGQGFANAVGMAIAEAQLAARYNRAGHAVIDHHTWVLASDGDLMEGVAAEAASLAGHLQLGKLIVLYDDNRVTLAAGTDITFTESRAARFKAYGWHVQSVEDGNDVAAIDRAIKAARRQTRKPSLICVRTHIGYGSPEQDSYKAHGSPLGEKDVAATKQQLGWPQQPPFLVPQSVQQRFNEIGERGARAQARANKRREKYAAAFPQLAAELARSLRGELPDDWDADIPQFPADAKGMATRVAGGKVLAALAARVPALTGGSADLDPSTHTQMKGLGVFAAHGEPDEQGTPPDAAWNYAGRNLHFGVREHAMGAIANGIAAHGGLIPFTATFLIFSDYMRPPMRLAALSGLHVVNVFTHDSIALGEDGPTHQPVEQLAGLRAVPDMLVIRPADANETAHAWRVALQARGKPVVLALSRQNVPTLDRTQYAAADGVARGAYVLRDAPDGAARLILIGTGAEVDLCVRAAEKLQAQGIATRVVSMPCWELFAAQDADYRESVLPTRVGARLAVEAGASLGWSRWVGAHGDCVCVDRFGASAPGDTVLREFGFDVDNVCARARAVLDAATDAGNGHDAIIPA